MDGRLRFFTCLWLCRPYISINPIQLFKPIIHAFLLEGFSQPKIDEGKLIRWSLVLIAKMFLVLLIEKVYGNFFFDKTYILDKY